MFRSLRTRLIVVYSLIIAITIIAVDILILDNYFKSLVEEKRITYFTYGNMVSNAVAANLYDTLYISAMLEQYSNSTGARLLFIDPESRVVSDSMHRYTGQAITNQQVRDGLQGKESWAVYNNGGNFMQLAVPVITGPKDNTELHGVILISAGIDNLYRSYSALRLKVIAISAVAGIVSTIISMLTGLRLSQPLKKLIRFSRRLTRGHLGETINIRRKDEIGLLAETINSLSAELHRIEKNRRRFIGNVSHELKTPLASIKALVESMLLTGTMPSQHKEFLQDVVTEADRLSSLIASLLTHTRLEEETVSISFCILSGLIEDTIRIIKQLADSNHVEIKNQIGKDIRVPCDRNLVKEMFMNLLDNSIKYRDPSKETSYILLRDYISDGQYRIEIEDNGIGISPEDIPNIFEGFYRGEPSHSKEVTGYGMGLAIVKRITELHGWSINVQSQKGEGTVMTLIIPLTSKNL